MTLTDYIHALLNRGDYATARTYLRGQFSALDGLDETDKISTAYGLYCLLTDIASEDLHAEELREAIDFSKTNEEALLKAFNRSSYFYNLANASHYLAKAFYFHNRGVHSLSVQKTKFLEPVQYYWTALNCVDNDQGLKAQITINLTMALVTVGRTVEAIQLLDDVLKESPGYPQALVNRGENLFHFSQWCNAMHSVALYAQIYNNYAAALATGFLPPPVLQNVIKGRDTAFKNMAAHGFSAADSLGFNASHRLEYDALPERRKFAINHHLTLNEHDIYCHCAESAKDTLQIGVAHGQFKGDLLPKLELLLNRMKSEFDLARWAYYRSVTAKGDEESDLQLSELLANEDISHSTELLRTSFRIIYGIMDKIALGICKLFDVPRKKIYFETFWEDTKIKPLLDNTGNLYVNALYSIACDLNTTSGELKHFKNWRNKLEHNLLILKDTLTDDPDYLQVFEDQEFVSVVDVNEFRSKTLHLLQLTRSAIFCYVHCVRKQLINHPDGKTQGLVIGLKDR